MERVTLLYIPRPIIMCGLMLWKRGGGGGHTLGSSYAEHKYGLMIWGGGDIIV